MSVQNSTFPPKKQASTPLQTIHKFTHGLIIGKFMLLHEGHCFLIDTALTISKTLHICLCSRKEDKIEGERRCAWVKKTYEKYITSGALVLYHITKEIQAAQVGNRDAPSIWAREISTLLPVPFDAVFASEDYGWDFARELGAQFIPIDTQRSTIPVSSTEIQGQVRDYWHYLVPAVREDLLIVLGVRAAVKQEKEVKENAQYFAEHIGAFIYTCYALREYSVHMDPDHVHLVARAQFATMKRSVKSPILCVFLPPETKDAPPCYEATQCHCVFTIETADDLRRATEQANAFVKTRARTTYQRFSKFT